MSDLFTVAVYPTRSDAEIARARLGADGVEAIVIADDEGGLNPGFYARYGVRVVVKGEDLRYARDSLGLDIVEVTVAALNAMIKHARRAAPGEACGLVAADDDLVVRAYETANTETEPDRFTIDPAEHFAVLGDAEDLGLEIIGTYHSHPTGLPVPSEKDLNGGIDPAWVNFIVGVEDDLVVVRAYRYSAGAASIVEIERR